MKKKPPGLVANCKNSGERGKSERSHHTESNLFCSATCCWIRNERKHSKANATQRYGTPSLQNDGRLEVKRRGFWQRSVSAELMLEILLKNMRTQPSWWVMKHISHSVKKQNFQYLHNPKVAVRCAIGKFDIIGPYFFEENGITATVNSVWYINMINNFLKSELWRERINRQYV